MTAVTDLRAQAGPHTRPLPRWVRIAEVAGVLLSPAIVALVLRLRLMAPVDALDPAMHTTYIVAPHDVLTRYGAAYSVNGLLREGARVGFLLPARLAYLAFGSVPGFFVLRYVFALLAAGPVYLLLRRLYGRPAGVAGLLIVLSSPVLVTAWGTDYPDSAVVSYAAGAIACLAMPGQSRWRRGWLAAAGVLLTAAVWSHAVAVPLVAATIAGYVGVRLARNRTGLITDLAILAGIAGVVTGLFAVGAALLLGDGNFIATTWHGVQYLSRPGVVAYAHSSNWAWAPYVAYLLVPPAVVGAFGVTVAGRVRQLPVPVLLVGVAVTAQVVVYAGLQFFGTVETLEEHYFSSTLWAGVCVLLAICIGELARPLAGRPLARWVPAAVLLAIPLLYEADPHVPAFGWVPAGLLLGALMIAAAAAARSAGRVVRPVLAATATGLAVSVLAGAALLLTVAPIPRHAPPPHTASTDDPAPAYATALGGSSATIIDVYRVATSIPLFVGPATYRGEQLLIWSRRSPRFGNPEFAGMYHGLFNSIPSDPGVFSAWDRLTIQKRRPAEILLFGQSAARFPAAVAELGPYQPSVIRSGTLRSGPVVLHLWLIRIGRYFGYPAGG
jgi:hypothetical protein